VTERRVKMSVERVLAYPAVRFTIDDQAIDATVFPADGIRQAPVSRWTASRCAAPTWAK